MFLLESTSWLSIILNINDVSLLVGDLPAYWITVWAIVSGLNDVSFHQDWSLEVVSEFPSTSSSIFIEIITVEWSSKLAPVSCGSVPWSFSIVVSLSAFNSLESRYATLFVIDFLDIIGDSKVDNFVSSHISCWCHRFKTVIICQDQELGKLTE